MCAAYDRARVRNKPLEVRAWGPTPVSGPHRRAISDPQPVQGCGPVDEEPRRESLGCRAVDAAPVRPALPASPTGKGGPPFGTSDPDFRPSLWLR